MNFDAKERAVLAELADVLIPAGEGLPSASEACVATSGLNQVLSFRPDVAEGLKQLIAAAAGRATLDFVAELRRENPDGFALLAEFVSGAYFLNEGVRKKLGYAGQVARPIEVTPDYDEPLLKPVIDRGPIYRATPRK